MKGIIILTSRKPLNYFFIRKIAERVPVELVIYEAQGIAKHLKLLRLRMKKLGLQKTFLQLLFVLLHRWFLSPLSQKKVNTLLGQESLFAPSLPSLDVENVNSLAVYQLLAEKKPFAVVVSGTGILRKQLLALPIPFINIHTGITPKYRGVFGGFWALFNRDFENIGVTVHLVDQGVDTGNILYQDKIALDPQFDTFDTIAARQYIQGAQLMIKALNDAAQGMLEPFEGKGESNQWYHPTIGEYRAGMWILKHEYEKKT